MGYKCFTDKFAILSPDCNFILGLNVNKSKEESPGIFKIQHLLQQAKLIKIPGNGGMQQAHKISGADASVMQQKRKVAKYIVSSFEQTFQLQSFERSKTQSGPFFFKRCQTLTNEPVQITKSNAC